MLSVRQVHKSYGDLVALRGIDLEVGAGSIVSMLGRNGAGKSTLLSIIAGLKAPDSGNVFVDELDVHANHRAVTKLLGVAPQETGIYKPLTVEQNLRFFGELAGLSTSDAKRRAAEVADQFSLAAMNNRRASTLSGGEARRLHTTCALVHEPRLLLLDEPTVGADIETRNEIIDAVIHLAANGTAVVYTTHYLPEVERLGGQIAIVESGQILASGTHEALVDKYSTPGLRVRFEGDLGAALPGVDIRPGPSDDAVVDLTTVADLMNRLGSHASQVTAVERISADLESVFLAVTKSSIEDES